MVNNLLKRLGAVSLAAVMVASIATIVPMIHADESEVYLKSLTIDSDAKTALDNGSQISSGGVL